MVRHKGSQLAALQHTLHRHTVGTHPGVSQLADHGQSCSPSTLLSPPSVATAHCDCRTVQPSEITTCYIGLTDMHVLCPTVQSLRGDKPLSVAVAPFGRPLFLSLVLKTFLSLPFHRDHPRQTRYEATFLITRTRQGSLELENALFICT